MSWLPQTRATIDWWVCKKDNLFWATTNSGDPITAPDSFQNFATKIAQRIDPAVTFAHLFTRDPEVAAITDPKQRHDEVMAFKLILLETIKAKVTFHIQSEDKWEEGLTEQAARMIHRKFRGKISIDLMASSFNNYGTKIGQPNMRYLSWEGKSLFEYKEEWAGYGLLFPPEKCAYAALAHIRDNCQGTFIFVTKNVHPKPDWWPWFLLQFQPEPPLVLAERHDEHGTARFSATGKVKVQDMRTELWAFRCLADGFYRAPSEDES